MEPVDCRVAVAEQEASAQEHRLALAQEPNTPLQSVLVEQQAQQDIIPVVGLVEIRCLALLLLPEAVPEA